LLEARALGLALLLSLPTSRARSKVEREKSNLAKTLANLYDNELVSNYADVDLCFGSQTEEVGLPVSDKSLVS